MFAFAIWDGRAAGSSGWCATASASSRSTTASTTAGSRSPPRSRRCSRIRDRSAPSTRRRSTTTSRSSTTPAPQTLFAGIRKLPAGTWLRVDATATIDGAALLGRAGTDVDAARQACPTARSRSGVLDELRTRGRSCRKVSDVPVGVFLSGGIDSSTNAALFSEGESTAGQDLLDRLRGRLRRATRTSSTTRGGWSPSVRRRAPRAAADARTTCSTSCRGWCSCRTSRSPTRSACPLYYVSKLARDNGVVVARSARVPTSCSAATRPGRRSATPAAGRPAGAARRSSAPALAALAAGGPGPRRAYEWLRRGAAGQPVFWGGAEAFTDAQKQRLLSPRLRREFGGLTSWEAIAPIRAALRGGGAGAVAPQLDDATSTSTCGCPSCC